MPIDPALLTQQIDHLWSDLAEQSEGDERALVRACSLTLVVLADAEENAADVSEALAEPDPPQSCHRRAGFGR